MEETKKVSVILPVYNGADSVSDSIDSVLNQTYDNLELIIVSDCSTDGTARVIEEYAKQDARIILIYNKRKQLSEALKITPNFSTIIIPCIWNGRVCLQRGGFCQRYIRLMIH